MFVRLLIILGLLVPAVALAQPAQQREVSLELVATGNVTVPASKFTMSVDISVTGDSQAKADATRNARRADATDALGKLGIPATALTVPPKSLDAPMPNPLGVTSVVASSDGSDAEKPSFTSDIALALVLTTVDQVIAAREALSKLDGVTVGTPVADVGDRDGLYRQAKLKALSNARADADAYAAAMSMRVVRVSKISESGGGLFPPGFQTFFQRILAAGGPAALKGMFESTPGTVRVDASLIVEFVLAP